MKTADHFGAIHVGASEDVDQHGALLERQGSKHLAKMRLVVNEIGHPVLADRPPPRP